MYHIEKNGTNWLVSKDAGANTRIPIDFFVQRGDAVRFLERQRDAANRIVGRKMDELEKAQQRLDMFTASLEAEAP